MDYYSSILSIHHLPNNIPNFLDGMMQIDLVVVVVMVSVTTMKLLLPLPLSAVC